MVVHDQCCLIKLTSLNYFRYFKNKRIINSEQTLPPELLTVMTVHLKQIIRSFTLVFQASSQHLQHAE